MGGGFLIEGDFYFRFYGSQMNRLTNFDKPESLVDEGQVGDHVGDLRLCQMRAERDAFLLHIVHYVRELGNQRVLHTKQRTFA